MGRTDQNLLDAIDACHACHDLTLWPGVALTALRRLVPCDLAAFNDFDPETGRYIAILDPPGPMPARWEEIWAQVGHQNVPYQRLLEHGDVGPLRLSDFLSQRQLRSTELYRLLYHQLGIRYQISATLEGPKPQITALVLTRTRRDFTRAELELIRLIRPHLRRAYDNARDFAGIERNQAGLAAAAQAANVRVVSLDRAGLVIDATGPAAALLDRHLPTRDDRAFLPGARIRTWALGALERQEHASATFRTAAGALSASVVPGPEGALLLLDEQFARGSDSLPLTYRERQVLETIAGGVTNAEAAAALGVAESTIAKHLEHVYTKLGVTNRGGALELYSGPGRPSTV